MKVNFIFKFQNYICIDFKFKQPFMLPFSKNNYSLSVSDLKTNCELSFGLGNGSDD